VLAWQVAPIPGHRDGDVAALARLEERLDSCKALTFEAMQMKESFRFEHALKAQLRALKRATAR
jgi:hypothetical protein